jgi:hypothetical protein
MPATRPAAANAPLKAGLEWPKRSLTHPATRFSGDEPGEDREAEARELRFLKAVDAGEERTAPHQKAEARHRHRGDQQRNPAQSRCTGDGSCDLRQRHRRRRTLGASAPARLDDEQRDDDAEHDAR